MKKNEKVLVTGANGHLGNNLVKELVKQGYDVRASVRNTTNVESLNGVNCEIVYADLTDKNSLLEALKGIDILFQVASVFKHWALDPEKEILNPNINGTKNILEAASENNIKKVVLVSSIAALNHDISPMTEESWSEHFPNPYYESKQLSEQLALKMAAELNLDLVTVLPSGMLGKDIYNLTPTMGLLDGIIHGKFTFDPCFSLNYVDVRDVAKGMILAAENGEAGNRYILGTEASVNTSDLFKLANELYPELTIPPCLNKEELISIAKGMEEESKITKQAPFLSVENVKHYYQADSRMDISKAKNDLGFMPKNPWSVIIETFKYLKDK